MWDPTLTIADFTVGYLDRFRGVLEKSFADFNWGKLEMAGHFDLAIPEHRIQYFKYKGYIVWQKATRIDRIFGSTPPYEKISDIQAKFDEGELVADDPTAAQKEDEDEDDNDRRNQTRKNDRPNYFVSFKITNPSVVQALVQVQESVVRKDPRLQTSCLPHRCLHVTLVTLQLRNEQEFDAARDAMEEARELLRVYLPRDTRLTIRGLECFRQRVLHACVDEIGRLDMFVTALKRLFASRRLKLVGNHDPFTPHVTLMKLNRETSRDVVATIDTHLWGSMQGVKFGAQSVDAIHLCKMSAADKSEVTGFYRCISSIPNNHARPLVDVSTFATEVAEMSKQAKVLVILRGLPGSGKSTISTTLQTILGQRNIVSAIASADHYFTNDGVYRYIKVSALGRRFFQ